ncbi:MULTISPECIES: hypothetical protein [unclassified Aurantimonas]|uniref:hypothetical protein n=1 Tax=unclassified Aurantimonas TaxID=2638230 RepID=UPI002E16D716|nr:MULTISPECIES: hypothetical protein [unclassified Aurantimonas]MEC5291920.1 hypothetical protein [Aurantimonas sp. C2-3-R2]MEC5413006.1 hypothetical protein [Aurantimonas sp. C2-4-R8]
MDEPSNDAPDTTVASIDDWIEVLGLSKDAGDVFRKAIEDNDGDVVRALGGLAQDYIRLQGAISRGYGRDPLG